ncbi:NADPH-dependent glutamate synthase beta subunit-like oxidoreductase [Thiogranum longum]|uniref:NADPH-dependent glutamate synthase beta subunit-like oxidoreductase n=1 Tax=Thiogranum longum TaxID=1537524 RepID=A0A4R1HN14_9GAMM|nr:NAD(P)-binding protein [Thiogranum longum]TCK18642.1 NADPH-dependent glutamate synthase beta subunit-like oxidoreductase [Thiogranum longum]
MTERDMTHAPDLTRSSVGTGALRSRRPVYQDSLPPCNDACPAGENIQAWLDLAQAGYFEEAWQKLVEENPLPAVHGRVCYHPCENSCNRNFTDSSVSIHAVERFLGDRALQEGWNIRYTPSPGGGRVLVVGSGPSGLSAAYHLTRMGHAVEIHEAAALAGGMIHTGIPAYRMPRSELQQEIRRIEDMGVKIVLNRKVEDLLADMETGNFQAAFIAVGAHISKKINIPTRDAGKILDAVTFLSQANGGTPPLLGRKVAIYGGGNTAMDAARTAKRLGAEQAVVIYRRDRKSMPAHDFEVQEALEEGVEIKWLHTISEVDKGEMQIELMELDAQGKPQPTGKFETLDSDAVILAVGQDSDTSFLRGIDGISFNRDGTVIVGDDMMTGHDGIFAGGDTIPGERSVTIATGHGKRAARYINGYLRGEPFSYPKRHPVVDHTMIHLWYRTDAPKTEQPCLDREKRAQGFDEIVQGLDAQEAQFEAQRCYSCGNCFECDGCYGACPEGAVIKLGKGLRYRFDYTRCTGCAVCYEQCPCHAIEMIPEPANSGEAHHG